MDQPIDNYALLKPFIRTTSMFDFYHVQVISRNKDLPDTEQENSSYPIMSFYIRDDFPLDMYYPFIKEFCEEHRVRAYINLNKMFMPEVRARLWDAEKWAYYDAEIKDLSRKDAPEFYRMGYPAVWHLDVDGHVRGDEYDNAVTEYLRVHGVYEILRVPTLHGFHICIYPTLDIEDFNEKFPLTVVHQMHPTILYIPRSITSLFDADENGVVGYEFKEGVQ